MKIKLYKQYPDSSNCGPIAVANALRILGYRVSHKKALEACKCGITGTKNKRIAGAIHKLSKAKIVFNSRRSGKSFNYDKVKAFLKSGGVVILSYQTRKIPLGHSMVLIFDKGKIKTINKTTRKLISIIRKPELKRYLRRNPWAFFPNVWFLKRG